MSSAQESGNSNANGASKSSKPHPINKRASSSQDEIRARILQTSEYNLDISSHFFGGGGGGGGGTKNKLQDAVKNIVGFKKGEAETIHRVLDQIDHIAVKRTSEGFNEFNFTLGVMNCFFIVYMFGAHPQHVWLIYLAQGLYMIPRKFYNMWTAKPLNQALYYLDFCWCMNFTAMFIIFLLILSARSNPIVSGLARESFFNAVLGVSCGTLMGANLILPFVACLFHDVNSMTALFIHLMPPLVMYTLLWHADEIRESWPGIFKLDYLDEVHYFPESGPFFLPGSGLDSVVGNSIALYLLWWIPYVCFMLLIGIDLPKKYNFDGSLANPKWDTVFHSTMRGGVCIAIGKTFRGRSKRDSLKLMEENDFDLIDFFIYMAFHMGLAIASFYLVGFPCFISQRFHLFMLVLVSVLAVTRGAKRYTYYSTKMYSKSLRQQFSSILEESKEE